MGTIDKAWLKLTCKKCGAVESASVTDRGSGWGGPSWGEYSPLVLFRVSFKSGGMRQPQLVAATCVSCGGSADAETAYGAMALT